MDLKRITSGTTTFGITTASDSDAGESDVTVPRGRTVVTLDQPSLGGGAADGAAALALAAEAEPYEKPKTGLSKKEKAAVKDWDADELKSQMTERLSLVTDPPSKLRELTKAAADALAAGDLELYRAKADSAIAVIVKTEKFISAWEEAHEGESAPDLGTELNAAKQAVIAIPRTEHVFEPALEWPDWSGDLSKLTAKEKAAAVAMSADQLRGAISQAMGMQAQIAQLAATELGKGNFEMYRVRANGVLINVQKAMNRIAAWEEAHGAFAGKDALQPGIDAAKSIPRTDHVFSPPFVFPDWANP